MAVRKPKPDAGELYTAILNFYGPGGQLIEAGAQYPGDHEAVRRTPLYWARTSGGQPAIDEASALLRADLAEAQANRERVWYGDPTPPAPDPRQMMKATRSFVHRGQRVTPGDLFIASHELVASAPTAFEPA